MPVGFETWTVLPHDPVEKCSPNLWHVSGKMPGGTQRKMVIARRTDGDLVIHNAIALEDELMAEIEAMGTPAFLVIPNGFHRQDAKIWKDRYPDLRVVAPRGIKASVEKAVKVNLDYEEFPFDEDVRLEHLDGCKEREGVMLVRGDAGWTAVFCDAVMNMAPAKFPISFLLAPTGIPSCPRLFQWLTVKDKAALAANFRKLADREWLTQIIPGHGAAMDAGAPEILREVARGLEG